MSGTFFGGRGLVKRYRDAHRLVEVLNGASIELRAGETVAVTGRSGSGKSTLLHLLGLLDTADGGEVIFEGREITGLPERERDALRNRAFGFVFQAYHLLPEFTAMENVLLPAMMASPAAWRACRRDAEREAAALLERVGLSDRAGHRPGELSGGEQQRVAIARAFVNKPRVLLCDEPTGNLDEETSESVHRLLADVVRDSGASAVVVTHDPDLAGRADRVLRIEHGRLQAAGAG